MSDSLTLDELARRLDEAADHVSEWRSLGLIGRAQSDTFGPDDVERARLVQALRRRGIELTAIVRADRNEGFLARYVAGFGGASGIYSLEEAACRLGLDVDTLRRLVEVAQLTDRRELLSDDDVEAFAGMKVALEEGFPEEVLAQLLRVYADALGRVAEAENRLFHFYVHEPRRAQELRIREAAKGGGKPSPVPIWGAASSDRLIPLIEPAVRYFHRQAWRRALTEDAVMHLEECTGVHQEQADVPGRLRIAIVFVDLAGFTSLTDAMGDQVAACVLERFAHIVRQSVGRWNGRIVKQIGDSFMVVFPEARRAVACTLEIERLVAREPQFAAVRSGVHYGPALYREGDYVGTSVNVAARLVAEAERHQVLVTTAVRNEAGSLPDVEFVPLGRRRLRGFVDEVELFAALEVDAGTAAPRWIDPVCSMELTVDQVVARLSLGGKEHAFCSQECLRRFIAAPERYLPHAGPD
jgi:class 3 adenylate cyclase/YHS domain-containing protein